MEAFHPIKDTIQINKMILNLMVGVLIEIIGQDSHHFQEEMKVNNIIQIYKLILAGINGETLNMLEMKEEIECTNKDQHHLIISKGLDH